MNRDRILVQGVSMILEGWSVKTVILAAESVPCAAKVACHWEE